MGVSLCERTDTYEKITSRRTVYAAGKNIKFKYIRICHTITSREIGNSSYCYTHQVERKTNINILITQWTRKHDYTLNTKHPAALTILHFDCDFYDIQRSRY